MAENICQWFKNFRQRIKINSCMNLIWLINFLPTIGGFPLLSNKVNVMFWIVHMGLLVYVYVVSAAVYLVYFAEGFVDFVNSFFHISVFIVIANTSWWLLYKRHDLNDVLKLVKKNDDLLIETGRYVDVYQKMLKSIKIIVIICYMFHFVNGVMIYIPSRTIGIDEFAEPSCVGLEPLTTSPNREVCIGMLAIEELIAIVSVVSYDACLLFLFSHTTIVFQILYEELTGFSDLAVYWNDSNETYSVIEDRLKNVIIRHSLALHTVAKLEALYSVAIGISFGLNAISMCLFFVLPLEDCLNFAPLIYHGLFIFFLYCFQGQRLTTATEKFEMAVYSCGWENLRVKERTHVLLMLKQAQRPVIVCAAKVIPISMYTFATTIQSIYKFVTIFKT